MKHFTKHDIQNADFTYRIHLINSITGIKPGNLIGTKSAQGETNLAIISSVVHLGSNPGLIGFIMRPDGDVPRHTYENIKETGFFTINHIHSSFAEKAHYTSAKFDRSVSEFDACGLGEEYFNDFHPPFVKESVVKIGLKWIDDKLIEHNGTHLIIGQIEHILVDDEYLDESGVLDLQKSNGTGIGGLNEYYTFSKLAHHPYARVEDLPVWKDRPEIPSIKTEGVASDEERFQNTTIRPIVKMQHNLLISVFKSYISNKKFPFNQEPLEKRIDFIENALQKDSQLRNLFKGMIMGHFSLEEYERFAQMHSDLGKRIVNIIKERLLNSLIELQ